MRAKQSISASWLIAPVLPVGSKVIAGQAEGLLRRSKRTAAVPVASPLPAPSRTITVCRPLVSRAQVWSSAKLRPQTAVPLGRRTSVSGLSAPEVAITRERMRSPEAALNV